MNAGLVAAWILITLSGSGQTIVAKQVRIDPRACHMPPLKAEYPLEGRWRAVTVQLKCPK
jgi:hypothetical protein